MIAGSLYIITGIRMLRSYVIVDLPWLEVGPTNNTRLETRTIYQERILWPCIRGIRCFELSGSNFHIVMLDYI